MMLSHYVFTTVTLVVILHSCQSITTSEVTAQFRYLCDMMCKTEQCPRECPQASLGPWARRLSVPLKRAFDQSSEFHELTFDDFGWFMKLLGRDIDKRKRK